MEPSSSDFAPAVLASAHRFADHQHLLDCVIFYADQHTRTVLLRLSKDWFRQVGKVLYETIHVHGDSIESIFAGAELETENIDKIASSTGSFKATLLAQVHFLTVSQHKSTQCFHLTSIQRLLPNLEVMAFGSYFRRDLQTKRNICDGETECRLVMGLRAPKIVVRNIRGYELDSGWLVLMYCRPDVVKGVEEYVICFDRTEIAQVCADVWMDFIADKVTYMFIDNTAMLSDETDRTEDGEDLADDTQSIESDSIDYAYFRVIMPQNHVKFEIVGLEDIEISDGTSSHYQLVNQVKRQLIEKMKAKKRVSENELVFTPSWEWIKDKENVKGVLTEKDLHNIQMRRAEWEHALLELES